MAEQDDDAPLDLSAIDPHRDGSLADRVIGRAMARIGSADGLRAPVLVSVARWWTPGLAAAALVSIVAGGIVYAAPPQADVPTSVGVEAQLFEWARSGYIPNNGDLFAAFRGLAR